MLLQKRKNMIEISALILAGKKAACYKVYITPSPYYSFCMRYTQTLMSFESSTGISFQYSLAKQNKKPAFTCRAICSVFTPAWCETHTAILGSGHVLIYQFLSLHNWSFTLYPLLILSGHLHRYLRQLNHGTGDLITFTRHLLWHYLLNSLLHNKDFSSNFRVKFQSEQWNLGLFVFSSLKLLKHLNSMGKLLILFQKYLLSSA